MSNTTEKLEIANTALYMMGHSVYLSAIDNTTVEGKQIGVLLESIIKELMSQDWYFNRKRILLEDMTQVNKLTLDASPTPAAFARGATLTGVTSTKTCTVLDPLSATVYLVTEPSGDFTDGEVIGDGTNSRDCATGYPEVTADLNIDQYQYGFRKPTDCLFIRGIYHQDDDRIKLPHKAEQDIIYSIYDDSCYFKYNKYLTASAGVADITLTPMWFHRLVSAKLAWMMSANITENQKVRTKAELELDAAWLEAKEQNGNEEGAKDWSGHNNWQDGANRLIELYDVND